MRNTHLTKSRFKLGLECITKLYYTAKKDEYSDKNLDDPFLKALADGGFQVGELSKYHFCDDPIKEKITIDTLDYEESLKRTEEMLSRPGRVVIAEAAFRYKNLFIRADIIVKNDDTIYLYEVKAKSFDPTTDSFLTKKGDKVASEWIEYVYDIAFQKYVVTNSLGTKYKLKTHLMLVNKQSVSSIDGFNQYFKILKENGRTGVHVKGGLTRKDLGNELLLAIETDDVCEKIQSVFKVPTDEEISFEDFVWKCAGLYEKNIQEFAPLGSKCKDCQFYTEPGESEKTKSGFKECWQHATKLTSAELDKPLVTELWNGLAGAKSFATELVVIKKYFLHQVKEEDIAPKNPSKKAASPGLTPIQRRMEQVNRVKAGTVESYFDADGIKNIMRQFSFPLHMIDFETSAVAIPFFKGLRPYEGVAFQFSHHTIDKDWKIKHTTQYISFELGKYPNFEFARELKKALSKDGGTVFRYHNHENSYLNMIHRQLQSSVSPPADKDELLSFIETITHLKDGKGGYTRQGKRDMVDLYDLVLKYYYPPLAKGSNSLKHILPAMISESNYLKETYGKKGIYGKGKKVESINFDDHIWIVPSKNNNPYKTLPKVFEEYEPETLDLLVKDFENVADGGAALTAYNYLQFSDIPLNQRESIRDSLLRYCELDTMAMVMILEGWKNMG